MKIILCTLPCTFKSALLLLVFGYQQAIAADPFAELINERLSHMRDVAAYKWINQRPIEDLEREAVVIAAATRSGLDQNITAASSKAFFVAQIAAAKEIQQYWFNYWQQHGDPDSPPDLVNVVRPELLRLGNQILAGLRHAGTVNPDDIQAPGLSRASAQQLAKAAGQIQVYENTLDRIIDSGLLRVGTTSDYQPFSYQLNGNDTSGIDIDLARDLANSLNVAVEFVPTSWPTLMEDHNQGRFDIGMSGISINLSRAQTAFFSKAYHTGGKAAIARCDAAEKFNSLEKIDQEGVRLIVNPGGTNERFVRNHIHEADIILHPENLTIFSEIIEGRADVMITDAIEVRVKANRYQTLCPTLGSTTLSFQQKGYLLPQDPVWKTYVDTWLALREGDGTLKRTFTRHQAN